MVDEHVQSSPQPGTPPATHAARSRWTGRILRRLAALAAIVVILRLSGCMESLFYHPVAGPTPPPPNMPSVERVTFPSRDGTRLSGWFIAARPQRVRGAPAATSPELAATILHVHGNAGNITDHIWFTEFLPAAGFNLFIFDFRGYGESAGRARRREPLIADTHAALDYLLGRGDVDPRRIGMYGQSLGGSIGLNVMAERREIRAAVIESAFTSWRDMAACAVGRGAQPAWWCRSLAWMLIPDAHRADEAIARSAVDRPILIVHGDADTIIPIAHGRLLKAAGGSNVRLIEYPGGEHNSLRETHPDMGDTVAEFFHKHLNVE